MQTPPGDEVRAAVARIAPSALFDAQWYVETTGRTFADREAAVTDYVTTRGQDGSPHWLFADRWLFPAGRWRRRATDPLSHYLADPDRRRRAPHPLLDAIPDDVDGPLGPADAWLRAASADSPLPCRIGTITVAAARAASVAPTEYAGPSPETAVVILPPDQQDAMSYVVAWQRWLHRHGFTAFVVGHDPAVQAVAGSLDASYVVPTADSSGLASEVVVELRPTRRPTRFTDLRPLVAAFEDPTVTVAQALLIADDHTIAAAGARPDGSAYLSGLPVSDAVGAGDPERVWPGAVARRVASVPRDQHRVRLVTDALVPAEAPPGHDEEAWRTVRARDRTQTLRWALDTAGPFRDPKWGDLHFADALAAALRRLGQQVAVDHPESRDRTSRELDDVVLVLRGLERVVTTSLDHQRVLWVISHPELLDRDEVASYDLAFAAGEQWAAERSAQWGLEIRPLLQATDPARFRPGLAEPDTGPELLFVGNRRRGERPAVLDSVAAGLPLSVYGAGWDGVVDDGQIVADHVDNADLGALYAGAGIVLNDHWPDMAAAGFVSNRVFDVLATGARLLTDPVAGLEELFPDVPVFHGADDLAHTVRHRDEVFPARERRLELAEQVARDHSFDARARTLLDAVLTQHAP